MQFEITEHFKRQSLWLKVWEVLRGFLLIFYVPLAYGKHLIERALGVKEPELQKQDAWLSHVQYDTYTVASLALGNSAVEKLLESDTLDFPYWEDWGDPFRFVLRFKAQPAIKELENAYFDEIDLRTDWGLFLIRINTKGNGMTLCLLPSDEPTLIEVVELKPLSWIMNEMQVGRIELLGYTNQGEHRLELTLAAQKDQLPTS